MLDVHVSAENEHHPVPRCRAMHAVSHRSPRRVEQSKVPANL